MNPISQLQLIMKLLLSENLKSSHTIGVKFVKDAWDSMLIFICQCTNIAKFQKERYKIKITSYSVLQWDSLTLVP